MGYISALTYYLLLIAVPTPSACDSLCVGLVVGLSVALVIIVVVVVGVVVWRRRSWVSGSSVDQMAMSRPGGGGGADQAAPHKTVIHVGPDAGDSTSGGYEDIPAAPIPATTEIKPSSPMTEGDYLHLDSPTLLNNL